MVLNFAIDRELIQINPAANIDKLPTGNGWEAWPEPAIERAKKELRGPCRVAFYLALYTGQRKGDILEMSLKQIRGDTISVKQSKTSKLLEIDLDPELKGGPE